MATALLAAILVVAPAPSAVPLVGRLREQEARAHDKQECNLVVVGHTQRRARENGEWVTRTVPIYERKCHSVAHNHPGRDVALGIAGGVGCVAIGVASVVAGGICGAQVITASVFANKS